ncbi:MAG: type VI secretion system baseplate subunit TssF, partial [Gemmataceae bacterium]|nr:type VI secretion system baseplate subunit TssF [Gemmataceae bacterium]
PVALTAARFQGPPYPADFRPPPNTAAVLRLTLEAQGGNKFADLSLDRLRLHLMGEAGFVASLHETLFNNALQVVVRAPEDAKKSFALTPTEAIRPVGYEEDEGLLPYPPRSLPGYRLLTEFFAYPAKFLYLDLCGLRRAGKSGFGKTMEVLIYLNRTTQALEQGVDATAFRTGCVPVVNLFEQTAEPLDLHHGRYEYRVVPLVSQPNGLEVYSIDEVASTDPGAGKKEYHPFHSFKHGEGREERRMFWHATRRSSSRENDRGTEVFLNLVDLDFKPHLPEARTLVVRTTCTNRDLAGVLQRAGEQLHLELEAVAPLAGIRCLRSPTLPLRPPRRRGAYWRLISHLNLNHLSITDPLEGKAALQEILRLYDFSDPESGQQMAEVNRQLIEGITAATSRRVVGRIGSAGSFCRGVEVEVSLDEERYVGTGAYLFSSVLERFVGLHASINSFTQLAVRTKQGEGLLKRWPPRAGEQAVA